MRRVYQPINLMVLPMTTQISRDTERRLRDFVGGFVIGLAVVVLIAAAVVLL